MPRDKGLSRRSLLACGPCTLTRVYLRPTLPSRKMEQECLCYVAVQCTCMTCMRMGVKARMLGIKMLSQDCQHKDHSLLRWKTCTAGMSTWFSAVFFNGSSQTLTVTWQDESACPSLIKVFARSLEALTAFHSPLLKHVKRLPDI